MGDLVVPGLAPAIPQGRERVDEPGDAENGGAIGFGRAALRRFVYQVLFLPFGIPGLINALSPLWDRRRQAWHDKVANSVVVNSPRT